jgi:hypothetical protein
MTALILIKIGGRSRHYTFYAHIPFLSHLCALRGFDDPETLSCEIKQHVRQVLTSDIIAVRRHMKWIRFRFELFDILVHHFFHFKLRLCDAASVAIQSSGV